jgi:uncharacterized OsmC-like protein
MKNVNLDGVKKFVEEAKSNPSQLMRKMRVEVMWNFDESFPQMSSELEFPKGKVKIECDNAPFMGGGGRSPNPLQYCLFGMASCFLGTFASVAAEEKLNVKSLKIIAENEINLRRPLGISDDPVVEKIKMTVEIVSDDPKEKVEEVKEKAMKRCPAVYCITNPIPLEVEVKM